MSNTEIITVTGPREGDNGWGIYCVKIENEKKFPGKVLVWEFETRKEANRFALIYAQYED